MPVKSRSDYRSRINTDHIEIILFGKFPSFLFSLSFRYNIGTFGIIVPIIFSKNFLRRTITAHSNITGCKNYFFNSMIP